jgi:hypothetical protein
MPASGYEKLMSMVTKCTAPGCETLTMGLLCVEHEELTTRVFVRGRPFLRVSVDRGRPLSAAVPARPNVVRRVSERRVAVPDLQ